jgi:hypothetical protein
MMRKLEISRKDGDTVVLGSQRLRTKNGSGARALLYRRMAHFANMRIPKVEPASPELLRASGSNVDCRTAASRPADCGVPTGARRKRGG